MKRVVSVSLGLSSRDHYVQVNLLGEDFEISRIGVDGDFDNALAKLKELDGRVDAIGLGGIDVYVFASNQRYAFEDGLRLLNAVTKTPVVDGSGLKNTLERETVHYLLRETDFIKKNAKVLMVSAVDRFGMAEAFVEAGCDVTFGDLIFAAGIPYPVKTLTELADLAEKMLPQLTKLPFQMLYPTGKKQESRDEEKSKEFAVYYHEAEIIAGDFHFIKRYLPDKLDGQTIITNTTTRADVELLKERGARRLVTTTPEFEGRSFGTNVIEGVLVAMLDKPWDQIAPGEYMDMLNKLDFKPRIIEMNG
ncbi:MAG: quinate 5-dehydrogenase [Firmicutes bacterium]|nr:quinate 5-dehydrogenase [Bacillota bacterium]